MLAAAQSGIIFKNLLYGCVLKVELCVAQSEATHPNLACRAHLLLADCAVLPGYYSEAESHIQRGFEVHSNFIRDASIASCSFAAERFKSSACSVLIGRTRAKVALGKGDALAAADNLRSLLDLWKLQLEEKQASCRSSCLPPIAPSSSFSYAHLLLLGDMGACEMARGELQSAMELLSESSRLRKQVRCLSI